MSVRRHEQQTRTSDSGHGVLGVWLPSVVLAVLKLTVAGYWSWWRVTLPFLAFLGPQCGVSLAGFLSFCWLKQEEDEEEPTTVQKHSREGYNIAALLFFFQAWKGFYARGDSRWWSCLGC